MRRILLALVLLCASQLSQAATVYFDSNGSPLFNASSSVSFMNENSATIVYQGSGYDSVHTATGGPYIAFNSFAASLASFDWNGTGTFDLNSFVIAGAWGSQTLTIRGYTDAVLTYTAELFVDTAARIFQADWVGLTSFSIATGNDFLLDPDANGTGQHWAINAIRINEALSEVPLPAAAWMFLAGIAGALGLRRKAARKVIA